MLGLLPLLGGDQVRSLLLDADKTYRHGALRRRTPSADRETEVIESASCRLLREQLRQRCEFACYRRLRHAFGDQAGRQALYSTRVRNRARTLARDIVIRELTVDWSAPTVLRVRVRRALTSGLAEICAQLGTSTLVAAALGVGPFWRSRSGASTEAMACAARAVLLAVMLP